MMTLFEGKKLYAAIIAFLFIIIFLITFHIIRNHYQHVLKNVIAENKSMARCFSSLIYEHQKTATGILESYARRSLFIDAVKKKDFHRAVYHLKSLNENHTEMDALFISDQYGTVWANYPVSKESYGKNLAYRDWYKGVSRKWRPYISTVFRLIVPEKDLAVAVSVPVSDKKGKVIGIFGSTQRTPFLAAFIKENTIDPRKSIALLDQKGNIIFSNAVPEKEISKYPDAHVLEKALAGVIIDMEIADANKKGGISYVSIAPVRGLGWSVIVRQQKNAILKSLSGYFILSAVAGFVIFFFLTVSLLYFRREYRYRKTKELLQAEKKYRNLFNDAILGIYQTTPEGRFLSANPALARMYGYDTPEELIHSITDLATQSYVNPEDREILKRNLYRAGVVEKFETLLRKKGGETILVSINARAVKDAQGNISSFEGTIENITGCKKAEDAVRLSEENFRHSLDDSPLGVRIVTIEGDTLYANRAMLDIYGYDSVEELNTTHIKKRYTPESYAESQIRREKRKQGDDVPSEYEISIVRKDGEVRHLQVFRKEMLWNGERQFEVIYRDITESKRAEKEIVETLQQLQETRDMLIQFEKHAAVGRLAAGLAHEILNPVSIISSRLQFLEAENLAEPARENVRVCREQLKRIVKINRDLHQSATKQPGMLVGGDLRRVIEVSLQMTERRIEEDHVQVEYDPLPEIIPVKMERDSLVKVMVNLILNACDAMTGNQIKRLVITVHRPEDFPKRYSIFLTVADNGQGIPARDLNRIFEPFFTTKDPGKGTGLGLSVSKGIIQEHGGTIHAKNNDMGGTSFIVDLPLDHP